VQEFDLIIIGTGSGNSIINPDFDDWNIAIVERDVFGGTCLNRGCIPSKMFVYAADMVQHTNHSSSVGVDLSVDDVRWSDIVERVFGRIDPIAQGGDDYREGLNNVTVIRGDATFVGHKVLSVDGIKITAPNIVLAAGARVHQPHVPGIENVNYHTSDDVMRLTELPERMVILGGGFIAAEMGHVFDSLGTDVTIVARSAPLLRAEDFEVAERFTEVTSERMSVRLSSQITGVSQQGDTITVAFEGEEDLECDVLLVATGRTPNGKQLGVEATGIELDDSGYVITNATMNTNVEGIWALGDISNKAQLKHTANAEAVVVAHNIAHPDDLHQVDLWPIPHAVFGSPQIASVGVTEQALKEAGTPYLVKVQNYGDVAYGWAMEDTSGFCKLLADPDTRLLLGAHIIGPQASTLIQMLIQGMKFGLTVDQMATGQLWIHPALSEVVENALLGL